TGWVFSNIGGGTFGLDDLVGTGHAGPAHTLLGLPAADNKYDSADGSIAGNNPHNPFLFHTATFVFSLTGATGTPQVTGTTFQFGTTDGEGRVTGGGCTGDQCGGGGQAVPEPTAMALGGAGLLLISLLRRRR